MIFICLKIIKLVDETKLSHEIMCILNHIYMTYVYICSQVVIKL